MEQVYRLPPSGCEAAARLAIEKGWNEAAAYWLSCAIARTIGHKRRDKYERMLAEALAGDHVGSDSLSPRPLESSRKFEKLLYQKRYNGQTYQMRRRNGDGDWTVWHLDGGDWTLCGRFSEKQAEACTALWLYLAGEHDEK